MKIIVKKSFLDLNTTNDYLIEKVQNIINKVSSLNNLTFVLNKNEEPKYCYTAGTGFQSHHCYVPLKFKHDDLFKCIEKNFNSLNIENLAEIYIMLHELGHAKHHETLGNNNSYYFPVIIKQGSNLYYLYNGSSSENKINQFMSENYKEAFADCFAAFALYKEYGKIEVFDKISKIREERYHYFKNKHGNEFIHPNSDFHSVKYLKKIIEKINKLHNQITYAEIESYLETSILRGSIKTI